MMNNTLKKIAIVIAAATMSLTATSSAVFANDGTGISAMNVTVQSIDQQMVVTAKSGANVRTAPGTNARIITALDYNTKIHVTGKTSNGWYQMTIADPVYGGETGGYIAGNLLSAANDVIQIIPAAPTTKKYNAKYPWIIETNSSNTSRIKKERGELSHDNDTFTVKVESGYLALRNSAVTDPANEIAELQNGQMVQVQTYGTQFDYVYVPAIDAYGYVNNDYLVG